MATYKIKAYSRATSESVRLVKQISYGFSIAVSISSKWKG
jgi:hypothetical protein